MTVADGLAKIEMPILLQGEHVIEIDHETYGPTCGVLPLGVESSHVETKGLRWDFGEHESRNNLDDWR